MVRPVGLLPKAHLHLHFTGSMRPATLVALADKHSLRLPEALTRSWPPRLSAADERGWYRFQRLYDTARACVRDEADMRRIVREAAFDDAAEGSRWLEIQVDPTSYAPFVGGITPALEIILDEARSVSGPDGIGVAVIVAANRIRHPLHRTIQRPRYSRPGRKLAATNYLLGCDSRIPAAPAPTSRHANSHDRPKRCGHDPSPITVMARRQRHRNFRPGPF